MIRLLIADDEYTTRNGLKLLVQQSMLPIDEINVAADGTDALKSAEESPPDILLTDVRMPQMDGIALSTALRKLKPDCQIVFISGYSDKEYLKSAIALKAVRYVEKPILDDELIDALRSAIDALMENRKKDSVFELDAALSRHQEMLLREKLLLSVTNPSLSAEERMQLQNFWPEKAAPLYRILLIKTALGYDTRAEEMLRNRISDLLGKAFPEPLMSEKSSGLLIALIRGEGPDEASMNQILTGLPERLSSAPGDTPGLFIAAGPSVSDVSGLYGSYEGAQSCLKHFFFYGYGRICLFDASAVFGTEKFTITDETTSRFRDALRSNRINNNIVLANSLYRQFSAFPFRYDIDSIKDTYYHLLNIMDAISREKGILSLFSGSADYIWSSISTIETLSGLQDYLIEKLTQFSRELSSKKGPGLLVVQIQQYVQLHFSESDLSISKISDALHFTPAYLCQVYKKETKTTINNYINEYRIQQASELLKSPRIHSYEVAMFVGYNDSGYFARQFKKIIGMTPSDFKEKHGL